MIHWNMDSVNPIPYYNFSFLISRLDNAPVFPEALDMKTYLEFSVSLVYNFIL